MNQLERKRSAAQDVFMPSIVYTRGDATLPCAKPAVIVHVCNDVGAWGAGFVLALSRRWKEPERAYRAAFAGGKRLALGEVQFVEVEPGLWVCNMVGQHGIRLGRDARPPIRYEAVREGLRKAAAFTREQKAGVHMPRIGCGLAGGRWEEIEPIVHETIIAAGVAVTVYDL